MAEQKRKSQAEKVVTAAKSKKSTKTSAPKKSRKGSAAPKAESKKERVLPVRFFTSVIFLSLFALFLSILMKSEGALSVAIEKFTLGLVGNVGFLVAIPAFLYLFFIHAFSGKRPVIMRSICVGLFVLVCGAISHLSLVKEPIGTGFAFVKCLYLDGTSKISGGLFCGLLAEGLRVLFDTGLSFVILILAAIITLLGGMQITIPSIFRAVRNRPRAEWENKEPKEAPEPAAVVVNHIATKRIEYVEQKRAKAAAAQEKAAVDAAPKEKKTDKVSDMMRQIEGDIETPVVAAGTAKKKTTALFAEPDPKPVVADEPEIITAPVKKMEPETVPVAETKPETIPEPEPVPEKTVERPLENPIEAVSLEEKVPEIMPALDMKKAKSATAQIVKPKKVTAKDTEVAAVEVEQEIAKNAEQIMPEYCYPPIELLKNFGSNGADGTAEMRENTRRLNETLASFKIEAHIINVTRGPSVTRYEVELEKGVRLNKLTTAADDIALSLGASGVRIAAVPGKISVVGIEVPNKAVTTVSLREVIDSPEFSKAKSKSSFAVGKDIGGNCIVGNIAKLPHMLIAGTTGSGKSVCMNSIIISLLYKASPDEVKLIMVDPKMVELGIYNGIPHLLIPVVTDPKKAAGSLQWAVSEMMRRYKAMSDAGVRDLESYNGIMECEGGNKLPQVVVIIDELADLMLVAAKEVEESICRIAQMGRASGIHLIIATQRPSADVITGLMKANIPSRIAFAVASAMESRIILDTQGAEKLVGKGDMLYAPIGSGKPKRVQGCFVTDPEVEAVATYVKNHYSTTYDQQVMEEIERKAAQAGNKATVSDPEPSAEELDGDEMLPAAVDIILETGQASVSMLQRRLKLGYARAARIVDEMEEKGIVGPHQGSKPRAILITKEQWEATKTGNEQLAFDDLEIEELDYEN